MKHKHFSLIELMAVIAIIGIIASIGFDHITKAREHAWQTSCASGLSQVGKTFFVHMKENKNYLPTYNWMDSEDMEPSYLCPKDDDPSTYQFYRTSNFEKQAEGGDYAIDGKYEGESPVSWLFNLSASSNKGTNINNPDEFVMMFDADGITDILAADNDSGGEDGTNGSSGKSNNGHGNNADGVDSSNPGKSKDGEDSDPNVDDENNSGNGGGGTVVDGSDGHPYWADDFNDVGPDDVDYWYYNTISFRHLGKANHLMLDGSVKVFSGLEWNLSNLHVGENTGTSNANSSDGTD